MEQLKKTKPFTDYKFYLRIEAYIYFARVFGFLC